MKGTTRLGPKTPKTHRTGTSTNRKLKGFKQSPQAESMKFIQVDLKFFCELDLSSSFPMENTFHKPPQTWSWQTFGEHICQIFHPLYEAYLNMACCLCFSTTMICYRNMLFLKGRLRSCDILDDSLIITEDNCGIIDGYSKHSEFTSQAFN